MPFLKREPCLYPLDLFAPAVMDQYAQRHWWCLTTIARAEKAVSRALYAQQIPFYCPLVLKRFRSPNGRMRQSYIPLFSSYVFVAGDESDRAAALKTNKISRCQNVVDRAQLLSDLSRVQTAIDAGIPMTPEARIQAGDRVRVRSGPFAGVEGHVVRREGRTRLLLSVRFIEQGVSMEIDEALLEQI